MNEETQPHSGGAPTKYREHFPEQARKLALLGATDAEMAEFFDVAESTIYLWKLEYIEFSEAIRAGKLNADALVADKLHTRAIGAEWIEEVAFKVKKQTAPGVFTEEVEVVTVRRAAPPDTQAASLWLRNRRPKDWRETQYIDQTLVNKEAPTEFKDTEEAASAYSEFIKK